MLAERERATLRKIPKAELTELIAFLSDTSIVPSERVRALSTDIDVRDSLDMALNYFANTPNSGYSKIIDRAELSGQPLSEALTLHLATVFTSWLEGILSPQVNTV